jgi:hypothetical protein
MSNARDDPALGPDLFLQVCGAEPQAEASAADQPASFTGYNFAQWTDTEHFLGGYTSLLQGQQGAPGTQQLGQQPSNSQSSQASATEGASCMHRSWVSSCFSRLDSNLSVITSMPGKLTARCLTQRMHVTWSWGTTLLHCAAVTAPASGKAAPAPSSGEGSAGGQGGSLSGWFRDTREKVRQQAVDIYMATIIISHIRVQPLSA